jgi:hypothetical protein
MVVPGPAARVGCRPPAPCGWGSRTRRRDLWRSLSPRDRSRKGSVLRVRACHLTFVGGTTSHDARTPLEVTSLEMTPELSPERLPSARFSTLRPSEEHRDPCYVRASPSHPCRPNPATRPRPGDEPKVRATPRSLGLPRGSPRLELGEDAPHRLLQPTYDTSTRESLDYRARDFRRVDLAGTSQRAGGGTRGPVLDERFSCAAPDHLSAIRPRLA